MDLRKISLFVLLIAGALSLRAQDVPTTILDGPLIKADTLRTRPAPLPVMGTAPAPGIRQPSILRPPLFETKEQRAARINAAVQANVMNYMDQSLAWYRPPKLSREVKMALFMASLFLSNPYGFREGYVPLMNHSFPFIEAKTPGMAPYDNPYSPDRFPQAIRSEYDFATGKYKQVMVPWDEYEKNMARSFGGAYNSTPVPKIAVTPVEREMQRMGIAP
jgi:hypothetical protein